jgi:hypothetical protein
MKGIVCAMDGGDWEERRTIGRPKVTDLSETQHTCAITHYIGRGTTTVVLSSIMIAMALTCSSVRSRDIPKYIKENTVGVVAVVIGRLMESVCCYFGPVSNTNSGSDTHLKPCHC